MYYYQQVDNKSENKDAHEKSIERHVFSLCGRGQEQVGRLRAGQEQVGRLRTGQEQNGNCEQVGRLRTDQEQIDN